VGVLKALICNARITEFFKGCTCIILACSGKHGVLKVIELLKLPAVEPSVGDNIALAVAYSNLNFDIAKELVTDSRFNYTRMCDHVLQLSIQNGQIEWVQLMETAKKKILYG